MPFLGRGRILTVVFRGSKLDGPPLLGKKRKLPMEWRQKKKKGCKVGIVCCSLMKALLPKEEQEKNFFNLLLLLLPTVREIGRLAGWC